MSGRIDYTLSVPKNINLNFDASKKPLGPIPTKAQQPTNSILSSGISGPFPTEPQQPTNSDNFDFISGYLGFCSYSEKDPLWRKAVAWVSRVPLLPIIGTIYLLDKMGWLRYDDPVAGMIRK